MKRLLFLMPPFDRSPFLSQAGLKLLVCHPWHVFSLAKGLPQLSCSIKAVCSGLDRSLRQRANTGRAMKSKARQEWTSPHS